MYIYVYTWVYIYICTCINIGQYTSLSLYIYVCFRDAHGIVVTVMMTWVQILNETVCISNCANPLWKGMNLIILPPAMSK